MADTILVTYASKHGSTAEIAQCIADTLRAAGLTVDVTPAGQVSDVSRYAAVVLGSGVYAGSWVKDAVTFLEKNEQALAQRPVWLFSSGPTGEGDPAALLKNWRFPVAQQPVADRIKPKDIAVFNGELDPQKLGFAEKLILKAVKAPTGDFRNWEAIAKWAEDIARALQG